MLKLYDLPIKLLGACIMLLFAFQTQAQTIKGIVLDAENDEPLIDASVLIEGTNTGTVTDLDGSFSLDVGNLPQNLVVSYTGYTVQEVTVTD